MISQDDDSVAAPRIDDSIAALALDPKFRSLFTDRELETARNRLEQFGYVPRDVVAR
jgi:hypothetical protein